MPQTTLRTPKNIRLGVARPGQDLLTVKRQAAQFPNVGMTLRSYQYDPRDLHKRPSQTVVVKAGPLRSAWRALTLKRFIITAALVTLLVGGWLGGKFIYNAHKLFGGSILSVLHTTKLKGESNGRVNILLAGNSADDPGHEGASLTDSIMVMSVDTIHHKAFLLSIPRDLWIHFPKDGHQKINAAYVYGQNNDFSQSGFPDGGMGQLEQIIESNLGIDINYYALINYNAFRDAVNAVGGIDFNVQSVDKRGLYDPSIDYTTHGPLVKLTNGVHHLNGQQALNLARSRGDSYYSYGFPASDFDRTQHQRQMLVALKSKAVSAGVLANPSKLSKLSDAIGNNVKTDFKLGEVYRLYNIMKPIGSNDILSLSLNSANGKNLLSSYTSPTGESALIPEAGKDDFSDIKAFLRQQTSSNPIVQENASITLLNATTSDGLASRQRTNLENNDLRVVGIGDAKTPQPVTTIVDASGGKKPATLKQLIKLYGKSVTTVNPYSEIYDSDFIVLLGKDRLSPTTSSNH